MKFHKQSCPQPSCISSCINRLFKAKSKAKHPRLVNSESEFDAESDGGTGEIWGGQNNSAEDVPGPMKFIYSSIDDSIIDNYWA